MAMREKEDRKEVKWGVGGTGNEVCVIGLVVQLMAIAGLHKRMEEYSLTALLGRGFFCPVLAIESPPHQRRLMPKTSRPVFKPRCPITTHIKHMLNRTPDLQTALGPQRSPAAHPEGFMSLAL